MVTGKIFEGIDVSQILKSLWISDAFYNTASNYGMKEGAKWQFCNNTHFPSNIAPFMAFKANSPWPWPRDKLARLFLNPVFSARFVISRRGSAPGLKIKINGVLQSLSLKVCSRLNGGGSIYCLPISSLIIFWIEWVNLSGRMILMSNRRWKLDTVFHFPGHIYK